MYLYLPYLTYAYNSYLRDVFVIYTTLCKLRKMLIFKRVCFEK